MHKNIKEAYSHPIIGTLGLSPTENAVLGALVRFCGSGESAVDSTVEQICGAANIGYRKEKTGGWKSDAFTGAKARLEGLGLLVVTTSRDGMARRNTNDLSGLLQLSSTWPRKEELAGYRPEMAFSPPVMREKSFQVEEIDFELLESLALPQNVKSLVDYRLASVARQQAEGAQGDSLESKRSAPSTGTASPFIAPPEKAEVALGQVLLLPEKAEAISDWSNLTEDQVQLLRSENQNVIADNASKKKSLLKREAAKLERKSRKRKAKAPSLKMTPTEKLDALLGGSAAFSGPTREITVPAVPQVESPKVAPVQAPLASQMAGPEVGRIFTLGEAQSERDSMPTPLTTDWFSFIKQVKTRSALPRSSKYGHCYCPGVVSQGQRRVLENVIYLDMLWLDVDHDDGGVTLASVRAKLDESGIAHLVYGSFSDTESVRSCRVVIPLSESVPASEWPTFWRACAQVFPGIDPKCKDASHIYFSPGAKLGATVVPAYFSARNRATLNVEAIRAIAASLPAEAVKAAHVSNVGVLEHVANALPACQAYKAAVLNEVVRKRGSIVDLSDGRKLQLFQAASYVVVDCGLNAEDAQEVLGWYVDGMCPQWLSSNFTKEVGNALRRGQSDRPYGWFRAIREEWREIAEAGRVA